MHNAGVGAPMQMQRRATRNNDYRDATTTSIPNNYNKHTTTTTTTTSAVVSPMTSHCSLTTIAIATVAMATTTAVWFSNSSWGCRSEKYLKNDKNVKTWQKLKKKRL